jgi:uncharacterized membrane protein YgcG
MAKRFLIIALLAFPAFGKSLHWRALDVTANLDADGRMHVVERQVIVFDGDWNGGERTFRTDIGQTLNFESAARVVDGVERPLRIGSLDEVDHVGFTAKNVLRWRSRLASDPPFENTEITYILKYTLGGVLRKSEGVYQLNHDFGFPDRSGVIERFSLHLDIDPVWSGAKSPIVITRKSVVPGEGVIVPLTLTYVGSGEPAATVRAPSRMLSIAILVLFLGTLGYLFFDFFLAENEKGRFARPIALESIDQTWLDANLFVLRPEAAGTIYDGKTGSAEVAAMLARMALEKKIETAVEERRTLLMVRKVLTMTLLVDKNALDLSERQLVSKLFFGGANTTDTDKIRAHYKRTGFDPAAIVARGVSGTLQSFKDRETKKNWQRPALFITAGIVLLIIAASFGDNNTGTALFSLFICVFIGVIAGAFSAANSRAISNFIPRFSVLLLLLSPSIAIAVLYTRAAVRLMLNPITPIALSVMALAMTKLMLDILRTPEHPDVIALRRKLAAAREYFQRELGSATPRLRDDWYPYFLAFGLGNNVEKWFGAHGTAAVTSTGASNFGSSSSVSSSSSSSSGSWSFSGGGGSFGGAGASGSWAIAATAMGAGVTSPSSGGSGGGGGSSSGGGGGGGGSSSGGGGGGGW